MRQLKVSYYQQMFTVDNTQYNEDDKMTATHSMEYANQLNDLLLVKTSRPRGQLRCN